MKVGDMVKLRPMSRRQKQRVGLVVELVEKKCWRTDKLGKKVDWSKISPEPHAVVMLGDKRLTLPTTELEVINASR